MQQQQAHHQKLEEIRHAINSDDMKRAIKLATKLSEKSDVAKAMLAFCLHRSGKRDEALELSESLHPVALSNDHVLHWITYVYSYTRKMDRVCAIRQSRMRFVAPEMGAIFFQEAVECLFAECKIYNFAAADLLVKKVMAANRALSRPVMDASKLSIWAATLGFLRAESDQDIGLALAASFLDKTATKETAGLPLKRWIQVRRAQYSEALQTLAFLPNESPEAKLWMRALLTRLDHQREQAAKEEAEFKLLCDLVLGAADDFRAWARLCVLAAAAEGQRETALRELIAKQCQIGQLRGPHLAAVRLEFELLVRRNSNDDDKGRALKDAVLAFVKRFSALNHVVFSDLQNDLICFCLPNPDDSSSSAVRPELLVKAQVCAFLLPMHEYVEADRESRRWPCEAVPVRVSARVRQEFFSELRALTSVSSPQVLQILRYCGAFEPDCAAELLREVEARLARDTPETPATDEDALFTAQLLQDAHALTTKTASDADNLLLLACALLERQLERNRDNFEIKLALHELFTTALGAPQCGLPHFALLRVKQIQLDALGHLGAADLANYGFFDEAKRFATSVCELNSRARQECADSFASAFDHCELSSPVDMYRLELRLRDSWQFRQSICERAQLSLLPGQSGGALLDKLHCEVNNPAVGKSAICPAEYRLAVAQQQQQRNATVWNADLAVEYACGAPFGRRFNQADLSAAGPSSRLPKEVLTSKAKLAAWQLRESKWAEARLRASALLAAEKSDAAQVDALEQDLLALLSGQEPRRIKLLWQCAFQLMRLLDGKQLKDYSGEALVELEQAWREHAPSQDDAFDKTRDIAHVAVALSHAGVWLCAALTKMHALTRGKNSGVDSASLSRIQNLASKALGRISSVLKLCKQVEEKRAFRAMGELMSGLKHDGLELEPIFKRVKKSHAESLHRLATLASSLAVFE